MTRQIDTPSGAYEGRRAQRVAKFNEAAKQIEDALQNKSEAYYFDRLNYYIPGLEKLLKEHEGDKVFDHNLQVQHDRETAKLRDQLQVFVTLRDGLVEQGYRVVKGKSSLVQDIESERQKRQEEQRRREKQENFESICTKITIAGVGVAAFGIIIAVLASAGGPLVLTLLGGVVAFVSNWLKGI